MAVRLAGHVVLLEAAFLSALRELRLEVMELVG
jgi:hypothetical protein